MDQDSTRKLTTIIFVDIVGYTLSMQKDGDKTLNTLDKFQEVLESEVSKNKGRIVQYFGDGCLLSFESTYNSVQCAISIQRKFILIEVPVRIGIHLGEVLFKNNNVFGDGVNIASRIESFGIPGSILISKTVQNQINNATDFHSITLGLFKFKNISEPIEVYAITNEGLVIPNKKQLSGKGERVSPTNKYLIIGAVILLFSSILFFQTKYNGDAMSNTNSASTLTTEFMPPEGTIAVLPLINLNEEKDEISYFSNGLSQEIIDQLAKVSSLKVTAFTQSIYYNNKGLSPREIAEKLNVKYLVSGSIRILEETQVAKLSIELLNTLNQERLWNTSFQKSVQEFPTLQMSIAKKVVENLDIKLNEKERLSLNEISTENGQAFKLFFQAKSEIDKLTKVSLIRSQKLLNKAITLDPSYAQAYTLLAWSLTLSGDPTLFPGAISSTESVALITPLLEKSLSINPNSSDTYLTRAALNLFYRNKIKDAEWDVKKAMELKSWPRIPTNSCTCIITLTHVTLHDIIKAKKAVNLSIFLDPENVLLLWEQANVSMIEGDYATAQKLYGEAVEMLDDFYFNTFLGWSYYHDKAYDDALMYFQKAYGKSEMPMAMTVAYLSNTYWQMGDEVKSNYYLKELEERNIQGEPHMNLFLAMIYSARNDEKNATRYLEQSLIANEVGLAIFTSIDPVFKNLNGNEIFSNIRKQMQFNNLSN